MPSNRDDLISTLGNTYPLLFALVGRETDAALDYRLAPDDWSTREILAHLVDDEMFMMRTRLERMIKEDQPNLPSHDEKKWYANRNKNRDSRDDLLSDFELQRQASLSIIHLLRDTEWTRTAYHPEYGTFTAETWLGNWAEHDAVHLMQIENNLASYQQSANA